MRKTLLQTLLAVFCAILCALSGMGGGGMMLGARTAAWAKSGGWANPYVTDGLVAMWDGEWNAGGGRHSSNPDHWIDCIGGLRLSLGDKSHVIIGSDDIKILNGNKSNIVLDTIDASLFGVSAESDTTAELCAKVEWVYTDNYANIQHPFIFRGHANPSYRHSPVTYSGWNIDLWDDSDGNYKSPAQVKYVNGIATVFSTCSVSKIYPGDVSAFINGNTGTIQWNYSENFTHGINELLLDCPPRVDVTVKCFRVYNRALSASEIAANYAVDKARFNLT